VGARVLIIEDNPANLELMSYLLCAFGHTVIAAHDGRTGLDLARSAGPDLVLCDIQLPDIGGMEVADAMRGDPALGRIPLIAVTALAMVGDRENILSGGFDGYLAKPIAPETFVKELEAFLPAALRGVQMRPPSSAADGAAQAPATGGLVVLTVDDHPENLDLAASLLGPSGYRVLAARGMHEALALARQSRPDLILSDVAMSDGGGYDLIRAVKADPGLRAVPFIFLTSTMTSEAERRKGLALGAARFIFRPVDAVDLLAAIEECLLGDHPDR
jgi:two-component system, cell cycle response regulator